MPGARLYYPGSVDDQRRVLPGLLFRREHGLRHAVIGGGQEDAEVAGRVRYPVFYESGQIDGNETISLSGKCVDGHVGIVVASRIAPRPAQGGLPGGAGFAPG